jgi:hypothetical protein
MKANIVVFVKRRLAESIDGCAGFVAEGCCGLLVDDLKILKNTIY